MPKKTAPKKSAQKLISLPLVKREFPSIYLIYGLVLILLFSHLYIVRKYVGLSLRYYHAVNACQNVATSQSGKWLK